MKLGFLVKTLGTSQLGTMLILNLNKLVTRHTNVDIMVFFEEFDRIPLAPQFSVMQNYHAQSFNGPLISTCLRTTRLLSSLNAPAKYFYVWDLEWTGDNLPWEITSQAYQNDNIELIARSFYHDELITKLWKKPITIMKDFDYETLNEIACGSIAKNR